MNSNNRTFLHKYNKHLASVALLAASSTLIACSQPSPDAQAAPVEKVNVVAYANADANTDTPMLAQTQSTSLQNVSATVYKDANCGCCKEWIGHADNHGMSAIGEDVADLAAIKQRFGVPNEMRSCHTTVTSDGYVFEGHVPAKHVAAFLANPPSDAIGLAVPGMPMGSPGMEYQNKFDPYQVMQINKDGSSTVYADIESPQQQL